MREEAEKKQTKEHTRGQPTAKLQIWDALHQVVRLAELVEPFGSRSRAGVLQSALQEDFFSQVLSPPFRKLLLDLLGMIGLYVQPCEPLNLLSPT